MFHGVATRPSNDEQIFDLLHLNDAAHRQLVDALDRRIVDTKRERRSAPRHRYLVSLGLVVFLKQGSVELRALVRPRNISETGIGFFHGGFLNPGARCVFDLKTLDGEIIQRRGTVCFSRHIFSHIHEVGAAFDEPIEVHRFVEGMAPEVEEQEQVVDKQFVGHVLCVDASQVDRALFRFHSIELGANVAEADDAPEGLDLALAAAFDLIICGAQLPSMTGREFIRTLRDDGYAGPICIWSDGDPAELEERDDRRHEVMPKPFNIDDIIDLLKRHLPPVEAEAVTELPSTLWSQKRLRPLILNFLEALAAQLIELDRDPASEAEALFALLKQVRNSAGSYGYPSISETAEKLLETPPTRDPAAWARSLQQLRALCAGACLFGQKYNQPDAAPSQEVCT